MKGCLSDEPATGSVVGARRFNAVTTFFSISAGTMDMLQSHSNTNKQKYVF